MGPTFETLSADTAPRTLSLSFLAKSGIVDIGVEQRVASTKGRAGEQKSRWMDVRDEIQHTLVVCRVIHLMGLS